MEFVPFFMFIAWNALFINFTFGKERDRTMRFPDYFFFAEKRLVSHEIETKYVKDLDHCELFCYMNDNCVSANFKKKPEGEGIAYVCELNNATHLEYDTHLITDADFYYRGSKNACGKNLPCQNNATCQFGFSIKGYRCLCPPGFEGEHCEKDIDECQKNTHDCHLKATCQNTNGSFVCTCLFGFNGDGRNCTDIDECARNLSCHVNSNCTNTIGSHVCTCHTGYTGDGQNCSDIDECSNMNICDKNASCSNTQGSYSCACDPKYIGIGLTCKADICQVHTVLHDDDRNIHRQNSQNGQCDSNLKTGWYRFLNISGVKMPTNCPDPDTCGAQFPGWLRSSHPTVDEGEVAGTVCFSRSSARCCYRSRDIRVKNCSSFYVYRLVPTDCPNRYCFINN